MFCHSASLQISPDRFKQVYSDRALELADSVDRYIGTDVASKMVEIACVDGSDISCNGILL